MTEDIVKIVTAALQALAILVTAFFASRGLHAWRGQLIGKRKFEVAEEILVAAYRIEGRLRYVRNPLVGADEGKTRPQREAGEQASSAKDNYYVPLERMQKIDDDLAQFHKARLMAQVYFGADAVRPFETIFKAFHTVAIAAHMLMITVGEGVPKSVTEWSEAIFQSSPDDVIANTVTTAVREIEVLCRPSLRP